MMAEDVDFLRPLVAQSDRGVLGSGDGGGYRRGERRASRGALGLSKRLLSTQLDYSGRQA
jgi:hypothetical protein